MQEDKYIAPAFRCKRIESNGNLNLGIYHDLKFP